MGRKPSNSTLFAAMSASNKDDRGEAATKDERKQNIFSIYTVCNTYAYVLTCQTHYERFMGLKIMFHPKHYIMSCLRINIEFLTRLTLADAKDANPQPIMKIAKDELKRIESNYHSLP